MMKKLVVLMTTLFAMAALCVGTAGSAGAAASGYNETCFGYTGTFKTPTTYVTWVGVDWANGTHNCFGISPGRHIFDTSPGHPWYQIPGGGLADGISGITGNGTTKTVKVHVDASNHNFCQTWRSGSGWAGSWTRC